MLEYILCFVIIVLIIADAVIVYDFKKYIKSHENELVENNEKGLMGRGIAMTIISLLVGIIGIVIRFI